MHLHADGGDCGRDGSILPHHYAWPPSACRQGRHAYFEKRKSPFEVTCRRKKSGSPPSTLHGLRMRYSDQGFSASSACTWARFGCGTFPLLRGREGAERQAVTEEKSPRWPPASNPDRTPRLVEALSLSRERLLQFVVRQAQPAAELPTGCGPPAKGRSVHRHSNRAPLINWRRREPTHQAWVTPPRAMYVQSSAPPGEPQVHLHRETFRGCGSPCRYRAIELPPSVATRGGPAPCKYSTRYRGS